MSGSASCTALHGLVRARATAARARHSRAFLRAGPGRPVEALRTLFLDDLLARPVDKERAQAGWWIEQATNWWSLISMARVRPPANAPCQRQRSCLHHSVGCVSCALLATQGASAGKSSGRRTVVSQAHSYQWLGSFGNRGNGLYREELRRALTAIRGYRGHISIPHERALLRLDGQYGTGAVIADLAGLLVRDAWQRLHCIESRRDPGRLQLPPDQHQPSGKWAGAALYDCPDVPVGPEGMRCRVVVATHPAGATKSRIGVTRSGVVYELFFTASAAEAFTASDVVALYLHRGAFEPMLWPMKTRNKTPTGGVSHAPAGQEAGRLSRNGSGTCAWNWVICLSQLRCARPSLLRLPRSRRPHAQAPVQGYGKPRVALPWKAGRFSGQDFALQPDGTLHCPAGKTLQPTEQAPRSRWQSARALCGQDS